MNLDLEEWLIKLLEIFYFIRNIIYVKKKDACTFAAKFKCIQHICLTQSYNKIIALKALCGRHLNRQRWKALRSTQCNR